MEYGDITFGPHRAKYWDVATHQVRFTYAPGPNTVMWNRSYIWNLTPIAWAGFEILLSGADFAGWDPFHPTQALATSPVVDIGHGGEGLSNLPSDNIALEHFLLSQFSLSTSSITRFNDQGAGFRDSLLTVLFDQPLTGPFVLHYSVIPSPGAVGEPGFTASFTPIPVPEPATPSLVILGVLSGVGGRRRIL